MPGQRDLALDLLDQQKFSEALPIFLHLSEENPEDASLFYMAGQCYRFMNLVHESIEVLEKAAALAPNQAHIFLALGISYQLVDDYEQSVSNLECAIDLDRDLFTAYNSIGLTYRKAGKYREALDWYSRAADGIVSAATEQAHQDPEKCFTDQVIDGDKGRVINPYYFEKIHEILKSSPIYAVIKNNIGVCLIELEDINSAREQFQESIEFIPNGYDYPDPYMNLENIS